MCTKHCLPFFKEIPLDSFSDFQGFASQVKNSRQWALNRYNATSTILSNKN